MNSVILIGRLTRDAEMKIMEGERGVVKFTLAVDRGFVNANNEREADFISVSYWTKSAEKMQKYLSKGKLIGIKGSIRVRSYQTPEGAKKYSTEIVADEVKFLDKVNKTEAI
jgi:single-strand DNA-binding protein